MYYAIHTLDGYKFYYKATETNCIDLIHADSGDFVFENESELLAWVAENIENIALFTRTGADSVIGI